MVNAPGQAKIAEHSTVVPLVFMMFSIFDLARGMWIYQTLAHAIKEGARYASLHGNGCVSTGNPTWPANNCPVTVAQIAQQIQNSGVGLDQVDLTLRFATSTGRTIPASGMSTLQTMLGQTSTCFPAGASCGNTDPGGATGESVTITANYPFRSFITMFWPGSQGITFGTFILGGGAQARVEF